MWNWKWLREHFTLWQSFYDIYSLQEEDQKLYSVLCSQETKHLGNLH